MQPPMQRYHFTPAAASRFRRRAFARRPSRATHLSLAVALILVLCVAVLLPGVRLSHPRAAALRAIRDGEKLADTRDADPLRFASAGAPRGGTERKPVAVADNAAADSRVAPDAPHANRSKTPPLSAKPARALPSISAVVLFHAEYPTLNHTLYTWQENDLLSHVAEVLFFLNGVPSAEEFHERLPVLRTDAWKGRYRVVPSVQNLKLGIAINRMVELAKHEFVLLLEKDWALIEPSASVGRQLGAAVRLLEDGTAHVVRYRHRAFPGAPLHARMMHEGREPQMLTQQSNLFCYMHHWVKNPTVKYSKYFSRCPGTDEQDAIWCSKAQYCQWTNNPGLFRREWFLKELGEKFVKDFNATVKSSPNSNMLDFEFYTNWKAQVWNDRDFVVALPVGLFEHQEVGEQNLMNTVWYAWNRLNTDVEEKENALLETERDECRSVQKSFASGPKFPDKFPIDFVRHYSYKQSMNRTVPEGISELWEESLRLRKQIEDGHGTWRNGVTDLTNLWYKICLFVYPSEPEDMNIGFVTALYHTTNGRNDGGRSFKADVDAAAANLDALSNYQLIVYSTSETQKAVEDSLRQNFHWDDERFSAIKFVPATLDDLLTRLLTKENMERVEALHGSEKWLNRVKARTNNMAPSESSVALDLTKPYILDNAVYVSEDAKGSKLGDVTHLVWFDANSPCITQARHKKGLVTGPASGPVLSRSNDHVIRAHLMLHTLVTGVRVESEAELELALAGSGFDKDIFLREMDKGSGMSNGMHVVDMKTIGGSKLILGLMKGYYDVVLRDMLRRGELGTGREAMSIAWNNVQYNFRLFDGLTGCSRNPSGDHACGGSKVSKAYMREGSTNSCKLYQWAGECGSG